ncbi:MAG TPA: MFS transporter [Bacillales bacterium]|nr:MFS transporter [Bacillales bacterium]
MQNRISFRLLWGGQSLANIGDTFYIVALVSIVYQLTGSATYLAFIPFFIIAANFVSGLFAPLVMEKYRLKAILFYSQSAKTVLLFGMTIFSLWYLSASNVMVIFIFVGMIGFLDGWAAPSRNAFVPRLVSSEELTKANSLLSITDQTVQLAGFPVGGVLVAVFSGSGVLLCTFALFVLSSVAMALLQDRTEHETHDTENRSRWHTMKEGWSALWHTPSLRVLSLMDVFEGLAEPVWAAAIVYVFVQEILKEGQAWWGFINASFFAGMMIGGFLVLRLSRWIDHHLGSSILIGVTSTCLATFWFAVNGSPWLALILSGLNGIFLQFRGIPQQTLFQKSVPAKVLPKVYSAQGMLFYVTYGISVLGLGSVADQFGVRIAFLIVGMLIALSALLALVKRKTLMMDLEK